MRTLHVPTSTQHGKNLAVDRGPLAAGAPSHGTTGTMDNPVLGVLVLWDSNTVYHVGFRTLRILFRTEAFRTPRSF